MVLLLRDILDRPVSTINQWLRHRYYEMIDDFYDQVWVVGTSEIFNVSEEYCFPDSVQEKVKFCGYIYRNPGLKTRKILRQELQIQSHESMVLVTPGGGEDGYRLIETYLTGLSTLSVDSAVKSIIVSGSEMPEQQRSQLFEQAAAHANVQILEFTDDMLSYMAAADMVVAMGGYNTIGEILSTRKRSIVVPRVKPSEEQLIRAERMAAMGLFQMLHPDDLTPERLMWAVQSALGYREVPFIPRLDMGGLSRIAKYTTELLTNRPAKPIPFSPPPQKVSCLISTAR